jgi:proteic killer suppression protein
MSYITLEGRQMIASIRHKGLMRFFTNGDRRGIPAQHASRIERMLDRLEVCKVPEDMALPGYKFHELKGERRATYAISVSANWRITFRFAENNAVDVDLEDYH